MKPSSFAAAVLLCLSVVGTTAAAADKPPAAPMPKDGAFDLAPVAVPVIVDGQVRNYIFVTVRIAPTPTAKVPILKEKEPFFRDALVRAAHRTPFTLANDYNKVDEVRISAVIMAASPGIAGPGQVRGVSVSKQQPRNLRSRPKTTGDRPQ